MCRTMNIDYSKVEKKYKEFLIYAMRGADSFSVVTRISCKQNNKKYEYEHDQILNGIIDLLIERTINARSWPGTKTNEKGLVLNMYRTSKRASELFCNAPNLFVWENEMPEDICFYKNGKPWIVTVTHERIVFMIEPTFEEIKSLEKMEIGCDY